jgi:catechol 2,3-dioxygenase-like lactoylglutathione lyase family enzyme
MDWTLEVVAIPVSDIDRAKTFYADAMGFHLDVDRQISETFRVVQLTPPGSACSIFLAADPSAAGTLKGTQLVVADMTGAIDELRQRGVEVGEPFHFEDGQPTPGPSPTRGDYETFLEVSDPDGNVWVIQEVPSRASAN